MYTYYVSKYLDIASRRKWWITITFLITVLGGTTYLLVTPKTYEARTLILVQPQKVPQDYVRAIVSTSVEDRLRTITQQVTSRTNLEKIISECRLLEGSLSRNMHSMIVDIRKRIDINVSGGSRGGETSAFTITYKDKDAKKAMEVANALASNFISENLKIRESQAIGTSSFLSDELESIRLRLVKKEAELKDYRERFMGGLPEQLDTNLAILERMQNQLEQQTNRLRDSENRKILVENQISAEKTTAVLPPGEPGRVQDLPSLRRELAFMETKYTDDHPDIIRLRELIGKLSKDRSSVAVDPRLIRQKQDIELDIKSLKEEIQKTQDQIAWYEKKVEESPKREQELIILKRDYGNLKELYDSLLNRRLEAEIAVSLEQKQKGEQFRVIDPAKVPEAPVEPDFLKIGLITLVLGLALGGGAAFLLENMDPSFKSPDELERELDLPVLVTMPMRYSEEELRNRKFKHALSYVSLAAAFFASALCIFLVTNGVGQTISFVIAKLKM